MTETIKFNNQELIQSHRINELNPFYEMLESTYLEKEYSQIPIVYQWADIIRKKDIPFAITKAKNESGIECLYFWVYGERLRAGKD